MPYRASASLAGLIPVEATREVERSITKAGGLALRENVKANTPVAHAWETGGLSQEEITSLRGGRAPGTLRASVYAGPLMRVLGGYMVVVATDDPIAPYVEWDTKPHMIYPRNASALRWFDIKGGGGAVFAMAVAHPGTHGQHMFSIGAAITEAMVGEIAQPILEAWQVGQVERAVTAMPVAEAPALVGA